MPHATGTVRRISAPLSLDPGEGLLVASSSEGVEDARSPVVVMMGREVVAVWRGAFICRLVLNGSVDRKPWVDGDRILLSSIDR